ncbi:hypothetical protein KR059_000707 [Drosophila kikkawai]|nr:hypothetical protein KR059_000707 [Drosophila kikkawai]
MVSNYPPSSLFQALQRRPALAMILASWLVVSTAAVGPGTGAGRHLLPAQPADHLVPPPLPVPQRLQHAGAGSPAAPPSSAPVVVPPEPGLMNRFARWLGLGGSSSSSGSQSKDQQSGASNSLSYAYPKPHQGFDAGGKPCSLCNKYPWVPMVGQGQQQQQQQQHAALQVQQQQLQHLPQQHAAWQQPQQPQAQASQQRQRAVQFQPSVHSNILNNPNPVQGVFLPLAVPLPPLYNAQPFRPMNPTPLRENVVAQSEVRPVPVSLPHPHKQQQHQQHQQQSSSSTSSFEIVPSHQVTDFVTSVEYPATFVQSHAIDLGLTGQGQEQQVVPTEQDISTVRYQLEDLSSGQVHQHLPASQLLTELGHFVETTTQLPPADNYPAASSQQHQEQEQEQEQDHEQEQALYYAEQFQEETSTLVYSSTTTELPVSTTTTEAPRAPPAPVLELNNHLAVGQTYSRGRETPKRLLDSPINHIGGRPFTRDPADLSFRLSQVYTPTQPPTPTSTYGAIDASGQFAGMAPPRPQQVIIPYTTKQQPRPFESWRPSKQLGHQGHQGHQGHHRQQPNDLEEEPHEQQESKLATATVTAPPFAPNSSRTTTYLTKILASNLRELLKRERATRRPPNHIISGVDISQLQHNIDGWTEQEYNSLSHRPSTPTIRGRSKHIPSEYLTTTTTTTPAPSLAFQSRQSKTTRGEGFELGAAAPPTDAGDLSTSINNLEHLHLLGERGSKRFQPIEDNRLPLDYYDAQQRPRSTPAMTSPSPSPRPSTTTTTTTEVTPLYVRSTPAPKEPWNPAQVAILPQTNEKVYVVTPQPRHQYHHHHQVAEDHHEESASAPRPVYQTPAPRFPRMRPTPGKQGGATPTSSSQLRNYTPDIFGLMGLSAYVPGEPVEIIDGNSKVHTIVTAAPTAAALQRPTAKPTMSPSPR